MKYWLVGYGSLMSHKTLRNTISNKRFVPVIVKGYKRIFNLIDYDLKNPDVLNIKESPGGYFNGVMFSINERELSKIRKRESEYELKKSYVYDFHAKKRLRQCLVFIDHFKFIDHHNLNPKKAYFILCREAAYHISKKFGNVWDKTTYLSDNERVSEWIKKNPDYDTLNQ